MYNYTLRYRTFDQLLSETISDMKNLAMADSIDPQNLIKVAKKVNYDLGLRINMTKEKVLNVEKGKIKLPDDFYTINHAFMCGEKVIHRPVPQGTHVENVSPSDPGYEVYTPFPDWEGACDTDQSVKPCVKIDCKGDTYDIIQTINTERIVYRLSVPVRFLNNSQGIDCDCPGIHVRSPYTAWIKDNFLYLNVDCANVYINYQGSLENEQGELLVPDHDLLNEYYEYALKQRLIENLVLNGENINNAQIQIIEQRLRAARNQALSLVNTPNFSELKQVWEKNRKAQYHKYYDMFRSYNTIYEKNYINRI
jgi:hypothetical protein